MGFSLRLLAFVVCFFVVGQAFADCKKSEPISEEFVCRYNGKEIFNEPFDSKEAIVKILSLNGKDKLAVILEEYSNVASDIREFALSVKYGENKPGKEEVFNNYYTNLPCGRLESDTIDGFSRISFSLSLGEAKPAIGDGGVTYYKHSTLRCELREKK